MKAESIILYGSYAKGIADIESDIDILIIGSISKKERLHEIFITLEAEPSIKIESLKNFRKRKNDALHQEILRHHVLLYDKGIFIQEMMQNTVNALQKFP